MREILFRGRKKPWGGWAEGSLVKMRDYYRISEKNDMISFGVETETIGQFTGLTDKNGKKIFEGDILTIAKKMDGMGTYYHPPIVYPVKVVVKWDMCAWMWETIGDNRFFISFPDAWCHFECEIIGNIHDNPELLGGAEDGK